MSSLIRLRLILLGLGLAAMTALTLWGVETSWERISALEKRLTSGYLESFRLADHFQERVLRLNNSMLRFAAQREQQTWVEFEQAGRELDGWIDEQQPKLSTPMERQMLDALNTAYDNYLAAARAVRRHDQPATVSPAAFAQLEDFERQAQLLLQLGIRLTEAHRKAEESFLEQANRSLENLRWVLYVGVVVLLGLTAGLAFVLYRDLIAPLRIKLIESRALLERHEKLASLGMLAAGIAHEIRNPLTAIKARLFTLGRHIKGNDTAADDAALISSEINRLEKIVQDFLQFARPADPRLAPWPADAPLRETHALLAPVLQTRGIQLQLEPTPSLFALMDAPLIKQCVINLVRNAADAIQGGGHVTLRSRPDRVLIKGKMTDAVILEVSDTGSGIPPEVQARLFDPFFSTKEGGTGLGLSIAARIIEKHGGTLLYQTSPGHGTNFGIVLPTVAPPPADAHSPGD